MTEPTNAADQLEAAIDEIHVPEPNADAESLLLKVGLALPVVGLVLIVLAWSNAADTPYPADQIPMLISGGLVGMGLILVGAGLFIRFSLARVVRFWSARMVLEQQAQTDRVVEALAKVERALRER